MSQVPNSSTGEQSGNVTPGDGEDVEPGKGEGIEPEEGEEIDPEEEGDRGSRAGSLDVIFEILAAQRRRNALYTLYRSTGPVTLTDLAAEIASVEEAAPERVATSLHHVHLPKLTDAGIADYDAEAQIVRFADPSDRFRHYLVSAAEDERQFLDPAFEDIAQSES